MRYDFRRRPSAHTADSQRTAPLRLVALTHPLPPSASPPLAASEGDELYQIAILIDELKHSDVACRLKSMRKLPQIGWFAAVGFRCGRAGCPR